VPPRITISPILTVAPITILTIAPPARTTPAWAVVDSAGKVLRQGGVTSATRTAVGRYTVTFANSGSPCALNASPNGTNANLNISVTGISTLVNKLPTVSTTQAGVQIRNNAGTAVDSGFTIMRSCDKQGPSFVVVNADGSKARTGGVAPTVVSRSSTGTYVIQYTNTITSSCTPLVTPGNASSTIENARLAGVKSVTALLSITTWTVVVRNPVTGLPIDGGFHFALRCGTALPQGFFKGRQVQSGAANVPNYTVLSLFTGGVGMTQARTSGIAVANACGAVMSPRDVQSILIPQSGATGVVNYIADDPLNRTDAAHFDLRSAAGGANVNRDVDLHVSCS